MDEAVRRNPAARIAALQVRTSSLSSYLPPCAGQGTHNPAHLIREQIMDQTTVKKLFDYDPTTGQLTRRERLGRRSKLGEIVGHADTDGYLQTSINYKIYRVHRLIWMWVHGVWPACELDHVDRNNTNNRITNLREATTQINLHNKSTYKNNWSGTPGVQWYAPTCKWVVKISAGGKRIHLGYFRDKNEAASVYWQAKQKYHPTAPRI